MLVEAGRCRTALALALAQVTEDATQLPAQVRDGGEVHQLTVDDLGLKLLADHADRCRRTDHDFVGGGIDLELDKSPLRMSRRRLAMTLRPSMPSSSCLPFVVRLCA